MQGVSTFRSEDFPQPGVAAFDMPDTSSNGAAIRLKVIGHAVRVDQASRTN
jgi:hypothetical protein